MKKKLLCLFLVLCTVVALLPVMAAPTAAAEDAGSGEDASSLYVTDGLVMWFDAFDNTAANTNLDLAGGKWKSRIGDAVIDIVSDTVKLGEGENAETVEYPWKAMPGGGIGWVQDGTVSEKMAKNGLYFIFSLSNASMSLISEYSIE